MSGFKPAKPTALDRAIAYVNPQAGERRLASRNRFKMMASAVESKAAGRSGSMEKWAPRLLNKFQLARQRELISIRSQDLVANDAQASSVVRTLALNTVCYGLRPQSRPKTEILDISPEDSKRIKAQSEWAFFLWSKGVKFADMQYQVIRSVFSAGEHLVLPLMKKRPQRRLSLYPQVIDPLRLRTPSDKTNQPRLVDGVNLDEINEPKGYWIANPEDGRYTNSLNSRNFTYYPAWRGHRPGVLHGFKAEDPEQVRGVSIFAPSIKTGKDTNDYLDFELIGMILAASFPLWIDTSHGVETMAAIQGRTEASPADQIEYKEVVPGQIMAGKGRPYVLEAKRPSESFETFVTVNQRLFTAVTGLPLEVVLKDFGDMNYSSARAALLEAWKTYALYWDWFVNNFCQLIWEMVFEEAWLRGMIVLPRSGPDFYEAREAYTNASWSKPPRGYIDPVKEVSSNIKAMENGLVSRTDLFMDQGKDFEEEAQTMAEEREFLASLGADQTGGSDGQDAADQK